MPSLFPLQHQLTRHGRFIESRQRNLHSPAEVVIHADEAVDFAHRLAVATDTPEHADRIESSIQPAGGHILCWDMENVSVLTQRIERCWLPVIPTPVLFYLLSRLLPGEISAVLIEEVGLLRYFHAAEERRWSL